MLKRIVYIIFITVLNSFTVKAQQSNYNIAELLSQLQNSKEGTARINVLLHLSEYYFFKVPVNNKRFFDSALFYESAAEKLSRSLNDKKGIADSYEQLSKILHAQGNAVKGRQFADKAIKIYKDNNYYLGLGYAYYDVSGYYSINTDYELKERIRIVEELALPAFQKSGSRLKEADVLKELGDLLQIAGEYTKALEVLHHSMQLY